MCQTGLIFSIYYSQKEYTYFGCEGIRAKCLKNETRKTILNHIKSLYAKLF